MNWVLCCIVLALGSNGLRVEIETPFASAPSGWTPSGFPHPESTIQLVFAVKQQNVDELERVLLDASNPNSENYGSWWSHQAVHSLVAPKPEASRSVLAWLAAHGLAPSQTTVNSDLIEVRASISQAEKLLQSQYRVFSHERAPPVTRMAKPYTVPGHLAGHLDFVGPAWRFPMPRQARSTKKSCDVMNDDHSINAGKLRKHYRLGKAKGNSKGGTTASHCSAGQSRLAGQAVVNFLEEHTSIADLEQFLKAYAPEAAGNLPFIRPMKHGTVTSDVQHKATDEANLDIQYIMGVGIDIATEVWSVSGRSPDPHTTQPFNPAVPQGDQNEPFVKFLTEVSMEKCPPAVFSVSYSDNEDSVSHSYAKRCSTEFMKAGLRGISLLVATGDNGFEGAWAEPGCSKNVPTFPASSPYITAVGGTEWAEFNGDSMGKETGDPLGSAGFSNIFDTPMYQTEEVQHWLDIGNKAGDSAFNKAGRGYPDISALSTIHSTDYTIVNNGQIGCLGGTSASTPVVAAMFALLNEANARNGKPNLGFLNPWIYENSASFQDITTGVSRGCNMDGFHASQGWDPVTGVGVPMFDRLLKLVQPQAAGQGLGDYFEHGNTMATSHLRGQSPAKPDSSSNDKTNGLDAWLGKVMHHPAKKSALSPLSAERRADREEMHANRDDGGLF
jgi:tripeptidyl-peptidase-1